MRKKNGAKKIVLKVKFLTANQSESCSVVETSFCACRFLMVDTDVSKTKVLTGLLSNTGWPKSLLALSI